jgi:hypothetical protein
MKVCAIPLVINDYDVCSSTNNVTEEQTLAILRKDADLRLFRIRFEHPLRAGITL